MLAHTECSCDVANRIRESDDDEFREVFAHMGAALAHFQLLELHLASTVAFSGLEHPCSMENYYRLVTMAQAESYKALAKRYAEASFAVPELAAGLLRHVDFRNALAHRYFVENTARVYGSSASRAALCKELNSITNDLVRLLQALAVHRDVLCKQHGMQARDVQEVDLAVLRGSDVFDRKVAVGSKPVIARAYLLADEGRDVPIFETAEGAKLFLTATGLEPASARRVDVSELRAFEELQRILPIAVVRRPSRIAPWHYTIRWGDHSSIEVRPDGSKDFVWSFTSSA